MFTTQDFMPFNLLEALFKYFESGESQYVTVNVEGNEVAIKISSNITHDGNIIYESTLDYANEFITLLEENLESNPQFSSLTDNEDYKELIKLINNIKKYISNEERPFISFLESKFGEILNPGIDEDIRNKYFNEFEELNTTTSSIYDLGDLKVLIILKDGTNLTSWNDVDDKKDVLYVSEDLSGRKYVNQEYKDLESLKSIIVKGISNEVEDLSFMFKNCYSLEYVLGLDSWDFSNIKNMHGMFIFCSLLSDISFLQHVDVSNVLNMKGMFQNCISLTDISPLKSWDVSNVKNMHSMFGVCSNLTALNGLESWDVNDVDNMESMFQECISLTDISPLSSWKLNNIENLFEMFRDCYSLKNCEALNNWDIQSDVNTIDMFKYCSIVQMPQWYRDSTSEIEDYIKSIDDEKDLIDIAFNHSDYIVRKFAVYYIHDEDALKDIIEKSNDYGVLEAAIKNKNLLDDEFLFNQFTKDDVDDVVKYFSVQKIRNEHYLAKIVKNDYPLYFRIQAIDKIFDKTILEDISKNDENMSIRNFALKRLDNL